MEALKFEDVKAGDVLKYEDGSGQTVEPLIVQAVKPRKREIDATFGAVETWLFETDFLFGYVWRCEAQGAQG
jgi:hypothetical protein